MATGSGVECQACGDAAQQCALVPHRFLDALAAQPRLLNDVLGLCRAAEHAVGQSEQHGTVLLEIVVGSVVWVWGLFGGTHSAGPLTMRYEPERWASSINH